MKRLITGVIVGLLLMAGAANAQMMVPVTASWTAPTEGSPVDHYVLQLSTDGGVTYFLVSDTIIGTSYSFDIEYLVEHIARVAGVDALDRQGPWSPPSDPYTPDFGPPTQPGKPVVTE